MISFEGCSPSFIFMSSITKQLWDKVNFSEILSLLGCHQKFLLEEPGRRRTLGMKGDLKVCDDLVYDFMILDKCDD